MDNLQTLRAALYQLLKMHYETELYDWTDITDNVALPGFVRISFYHLNSCYNAFCTHNAGSTSNPYIDWGYATENKKAAALVTRAAVAACNLIAAHKLQSVKAEFEYYQEKSNAVFDAVFSIDTQLHTYN